MKLYFVFSVWGFQRNIVSQDEFIEIVDALGEKLYGFAKFKNATCPEGLKGECYMLEASQQLFSDVMERNAFEPYSAPVPISSLVHYLADSQGQFKAILDMGITGLTVYTQGDPECKVARSPLSKLTDSIEGDGSVTIEEEHIESYSNSLSASASISLEAPGNSGMPITSAEASSAVEKFSRSAVGGIFEASGETCTPVITQLSIVCKKMPRAAGIATVRFEISTRTHTYRSYSIYNLVGDPSQYSTIPLSDDVDSFFSPVVGCVRNFED